MVCYGHFGNFGIAWVTEVEFVCRWMDDEGRMENSGSEVEL